MTKEDFIKINRIIKNGDYLNNKRAILQYIKNSDSKKYFLNRLPEKISHLSDIDFILDELANDKLPYDWANIVRNNINSENVDYILNFFAKYQEKFSSLNEEMFYSYFEIIEDINKIKDVEVSQKLFNYVKFLLECRGGVYKEFKKRDSFEKEKEIIGEILSNAFSLLKKNRKMSEIEEIISLIEQHFELTEDDGEYLFNTPLNIYSLLKNYLSIDFELNNFIIRYDRILDILIKQEDNKFKDGYKYNGWDLSGSGIGQSGGNFSIHDKAFVEIILGPALFDQYKQKQKDTWNFIEKTILNKKVSRKNPDFLKRAVIGILFDRIKSKKAKEHTLDILKDFIEMGEGIPSKTDLIFQVLANNDFIDLSKKEVWSLVEVDINVKWKKNKIPSNVFVEKIIGKLAGEGYVKAIKSLGEFFKKEAYFKSKYTRDYGVIFMLSGLLEKYPKKGIPLLRDLFLSSFIKNKIERFDIYDIASLAVTAIDKDPRAGFDILEDIYKEEELSINQQVLIANALNKLEDKGKDFLQMGYDFIYDKIKDRDDKFTYEGARDLLSRYSEILAKQKLFEQSLSMIEIFIEDKKSPKPNDDIQKRIEKGEDFSSINTARGWACWAMAQFIVTDGKAFISRIIELTEKASRDPHPYVRQMVCFPLKGLAQFRYSNVPSGERFIDDRNANKIEQIAFSILNDETNWKYRSVMKGLMHVFGNMRAVTQEEALGIIDIFTNKLNREIRDSLVKEYVPMLIFYAEFRNNLFTDWKHRDLGKYNQKIFQKKLKEIIIQGPNEIRSSIAWEFWKILKEEKQRDNDFYPDFNKYISELIKNYDGMTFTHFHSIIKEGMESGNNFDRYYKLWRKCLKIERDYLKNDPNEKKQRTYWAYHRHMEILLEVKEKSGDDEFLKSLQFLVNYPDYSMNIYDLRTVMQFVPRESAMGNKIWNKIIKIDPSFYDLRKEINNE